MQKNFNFKYILFIGVFVTATIFSACMEEPAPSSVKVKKTIKEPVVKDVEIEQINEVNPDVTPLQLCEKEKNKFNLIVNAPQNSRIRILNIKPKYQDCIALENAKYLIEVTKKGYMKHKEWILLDEDMEVYVSLIEYLNGIPPKIKTTDYQAFRAAGYNVKKLNIFIKKYPKSAKIKEANSRISLIEIDFYNYSPKDIIHYSGCVGFYPRNLVQSMLNKTINFSKWDNIRWAGSCENKLFNGRGTLYLERRNKLKIELKGKMVDGFFQGNVYNNSTSKNKPALIKGTGRRQFHINLDNTEDYKKYQQ